MLCILSGTQPFFYCPDDCTALAEITTIFGSARMSQCARKLGKTSRIFRNRVFILFFFFNFSWLLDFYLFMISYFTFYVVEKSRRWWRIGKKLIFSETVPSIDLPSLCQKLQARNKGINAPNALEKVFKKKNVFICFFVLFYIKTPSQFCYIFLFFSYPSCLGKITKIRLRLGQINWSICIFFQEELEQKYPPEAYCLLIRLLDIDHKTRITADQALNHPFLKLWQNFHKHFDYSFPRTGKKSQSINNK